MKDFKYFSEQQTLDAAIHGRKRQIQNKHVHGVVISLLLLATAFFSFMRPKSVSLRENDIVHENNYATPFSWEKIVPSSSLEYHDCFDGYQCARLELPMDYHRTDGRGRKVAIAIARLPAKVPVTDPRYGGAVLINPGGPGGSGVAQALYTGRNLQIIVDADIDPSTADESDTSSLYFDIIGFDPRGVNNTTPQFSCFPSLSSQLNFELQAEAEGMLGSSAESFMQNWQRTVALGQSCSEQLLARVDPAGDEALGEHVNTMPVARDMIEITERHAEWREKQGMKQQQEEDEAIGYDSKQNIVARTRWNRGNEKLLYWGRSYGTVLGATFAAAYPDRISRAVLDGVVDLDSYYDGAAESSSITDADIIFDRFFEYCHAAGLEGCPFYVPGGPSEIKSAYDALENQIRNKSVPVAASSTRGPEVITWTDLKIIQRISVYQPLLVFPVFAQFLADLKLGDGSSMAAFKQRNRQISCLSEECVTAGLWSEQCTGSGTSEDASSQAILCSDARYMTSVSNEEFKGTWDGLVKDSKTIGDYWASIHLTCAGWIPQAKWRLEGPYTANTSHPLLFVSTSLDPVTPLENAKKMSRSFPGSVVLQQGSEGHTTGSSPSLCIAKAIRKYFQTGQLPASDAFCPGDLKPLLGVPEESVTMLTKINSMDQPIFQALIDDVSTFGAARSLGSAYSERWETVK
ncbi:hypothetical protein UA08_07409 [Talaromyces atroroseus]|uniref:Peptidase S33 tripeptidyl aminopeptidase-like C-terminal domain-containing protein n=1 Tax=Talaromyces atroroseus TaxID=1441469 RepID=A0A225AEC0_TALAT|nr:hypothetical protein UA08_07409 [Talaromyces atroroseus]OKL57393.1 hypothetical protein UA08_07409 [Talaromyces atroroseus]